MIIAGVSVNEKHPPSKEDLIKMALTTKGYFQLPQNKAIKLIEKEIKESGLFNTRKKRIKHTDSKPGQSNRRANAQKRKVDKRADS
ncbi:MAG: hypothetical protein HRU26_05630 [Psychroserpens sp.]|nr:hypothetical protein [Psychroserpens sp.]